MHSFKGLSFAFLQTDIFLFAFYVIISFGFAVGVSTIGSVDFLDTSNCFAGFCGVGGFNLATLSNSRNYVANAQDFFADFG